LNFVGEGSVRQSPRLTLESSQTNLTCFRW
jgi:hypothetical protein